MKKILSIVLVLAMVFSFAIAASAEDAPVTLSLADTSARTVFNTEQQVWEANGIKLTNDKAASTSNVADYSNPARFYKNSNLTIEYPGMTKIVVTCGSENYAKVWSDTNSDTNATVTYEGTIVTVEFANPSNSYTLTGLSAQTRVSELSIYAAAATEETTLDGTYIIADDGAEGQVAAKALPASYNYGYLYTADVTEDNTEIQFTLTHVSGDNYTITDCNGKLLGMSGTYNNFNVYAAGTTGDHVLWTITEAGNGQYSIVNVEKSKSVDYSSTYSSFGAYAASNVPADGLVYLISLNAEEPEVTTNYYVTGSTEIFGNWAPCNEAGLMTKGEDGLYTKVFENVPAADADYELKVNIGNWDESWGNGNENYKFTVDATSTVTVTFNAETKTVTAEIVVTEEPAPTIVDIATALAGANDEEFTVKGVVTCVDSSNIYVQDATGAICVRMSSKPTDIALGDTIIGTGKKSVYNGLPQLGSGTYEKSEGATLSAKDVTIDGLTTADVCTYVKLSGVTVTEVFDNDGAYSLPNVTVTDGTNTIQIYKAVVAKNEDGTWAIQVGDKLNVTAAVGIYAKNDNVTLQLRNTTAEEIAVVTEENPGEGENPGEVNPGTGDMSIAALAVAMMAATAGVVVLKKKEF